MSYNLAANLFAEFVNLRQTGYSRDDAWEHIKVQAGMLDEPELSQLLSQLRQWESQEGRNYPPMKRDSHTTMIRPVNPAATEAAQPPSRNVIRRIAPRQNQSADPQQLVCPRCGKANPANEVYCYSCGELLDVMNPGTRTGDTHRITIEDTSDSYFGNGSVLYLQVRGAMQVLRVKPRNDEMVIGRASPDSVMLPDIDLTQYDAENMGVSRLHAGLRRHGDTVVLTDLGSLNYTFVNGQRLHAHEVRVLHDGDDVRFGQLPVRMYFREE